MIISVPAFASATNMSIRAAQSAMRNASQGKAWRGMHLPVVELPGHRGGTGGKVWGLVLDRCSPELRAKLLPAVTSEVSERPAFSPVETPVEDWQFDEQQARRNIIRPILLTPKRSAARAERTREIAAQKHPYPGGEQCFAYDTLRVWVMEYEREGLTGLMPALRSDRGQRRVVVTREWDAGIDLPKELHQKLADRVVREARSMVANDGASDREVLRLAGFRLARLCDEAGSKLPAGRLRALCTLNTKWAQRCELGRFRLVHMHDKDHKAFQDGAVSRIRRTLHDTPIGLLIGDVHYVDLLVAEGREPVRVRLIAWMDASSLFTWVTPVFLSKGKGVRQEDVAESLSQVALCPYGGIPRQYYLDNGSEYSALAAAMGRLSTLAEMQFGVTLAKPYSPTSKGEIEGYFSILESILKGLPGWIGGDRTNKKTQNKGKVVAPYSRGLADLEADILAAVEIYNDRPQSGRLNGLSPIEMLERKIEETGFVARVPSEPSFDLIFSKRDHRTIRQGVINFDGRQWHCPALDGLPVGEGVEILTPLRKKHDRIFVRHESRDLGWAEPLPVFEHEDRAGAKLQSRLEKSRVDAVRQLKSQIDPTVSTFEIQKSAVRKTAPNARDPEVWTTAIDKTLLPPSAAELDAQEDAARRAFLEEFLAENAKRSERPAAATAGPSGAT